MKKTIALLIFALLFWHANPYFVQAKSKSLFTSSNASSSIVSSERKSLALLNSTGKQKIPKPNIKFTPPSTGLLEATKHLDAANLPTAISNHMRPDGIIKIGDYFLYDLSSLSGPNVLKYCSIDGKEHGTLLISEQELINLVGMVDRNTLVLRFRNRGEDSYRTFHLNLITGKLSYQNTKRVLNTNGSNHALYGETIVINKNYQPDEYYKDYIFHDISRLRADSSLQSLAHQATTFSIDKDTLYYTLPYDNKLYSIGLDGLNAKSYPYKIEDNFVLGVKENMLVYGVEPNQLIFADLQSGAIKYKATAEFSAPNSMRALFFYENGVCLRQEDDMGGGIIGYIPYGESEMIPITTDYVDCFHIVGDWFYYLGQTPDARFGGEYGHIGRVPLTGGETEWLD